MTDPAREAFEEWARRYVSPDLDAARNEVQIACRAWEARQSEIDALCEQSRVDGMRIQRLVEANNALAADNGVLNIIARMLDRAELDSGMLDDVANVVRSTGRQIRDPE